MVQVSSIQYNIFSYGMERYSSDATGTRSKVGGSLSFFNSTTSQGNVAEDNHDGSSIPVLVEEYSLCELAIVMRWWY
ncbi:MAG: hypothetical protein EPO24_04575 [Bacteroidetes bacterium]|nr:MAG: hypothetical protein EPO24_04575 [Bacteroidota bacterium]